MYLLWLMSKWDSQQLNENANELFLLRRQTFHETGYQSSWKHLFLFQALWQPKWPCLELEGMSTQEFQTERKCEEQSHLSCSGLTCLPLSLIRALSSVQGSFPPNLHFWAAPPVILKSSVWELLTQSKLPHLWEINQCPLLIHASEGKPSWGCPVGPLSIEI